MDHWRRWTQHVTTVLLIASVTLIVPALVGFGATIPVALAIALVSAALWTVRDQLAELPTVVGYNLGRHARDSWVGPALGAAIVIVALGSPPPELQAFGGIAGLLGMLNYFLRPLYLSVLASLRHWGQKLG